MDGSTNCRVYLHMKTVIFAAVFLLLLFPIYAFDCSLTIDEDYCNEINNSELNETEREIIYSILLYQNNSFPDHNFIENYNLQINVDSPPNNTQIYNSNQIKNAWMSFLSIFPSVYENNVLYVPDYTNTLSEYDYDVEIPEENADGDCETDYTLVNNQAILNYYLNNDYLGEGKQASLNINQDGTLKAELNINTNIQVDHFNWYRYCCVWGKKGKCIWYCKKCKYSFTEYESDNIKIEEEEEVNLYTEEPFADLTIVNQYYNITKGTFTVENYSYFKLNFEDSYITKQNYYYDLIFDKKPYYFVYLEAHNTNKTTLKNLYLANNSFFVKNTANCSLFASNHFYNYSSGCDLTLYQEDINELSIEEKTIDLSLLIHILTILFVIYIIYRLIKSQFNKIIIPILFLIIFTPFALATEEECGLTNLASCIPEKLYEYLLYIINLPILPLLAGVQALLTVDVSISLFGHLWSVVRYILTFFYLFLFLYVGYTFLVSSANPIKRAQAKDMLKNIFLMILLIQSSYYIYDLVLSLSSNLNIIILDMIDPQFFMITVDNVVNIGLEFIYSTTYVATLFITMLMLVLRYIMVCFGVVLFPIGLFCYFIPPLKGYGRFIINILGIFIFVTFIDLLIILACSMIILDPFFENFKILVMVTCFCMVNYTLFLAIKCALTMSTTMSIKDDLNQSIKYLALVA
jgi:hypothetical protein